MIDHAEVTCPWCFETVEISIEADVEGAFVQDCEVCCHPWSVRASRDEEGQLSVDIDRA